MSNTGDKLSVKEQRSLLLGPIEKALAIGLYWRLESCSSFERPIEMLLALEKEVGVLLRLNSRKKILRFLKEYSDDPS